MKKLLKIALPIFVVVLLLGLGLTIGANYTSVAAANDLAQNPQQTATPVPGQPQNKNKSVKPNQPGRPFQKNQQPAPAQPAQPRQPNQPGQPAQPRQPVQPPAPFNRDWRNLPQMPFGRNLMPFNRGWGNLPFQNTLPRVAAVQSDTRLLRLALFLLGLNALIGLVVLGLLIWAIVMLVNIRRRTSAVPVMAAAPIPPAPAPLPPAPEPAIPDPSPSVEEQG